MNQYFDDLEVREPSTREEELMTALSLHIEYAKTHSEAMREILANVDSNKINSRSALALLPVTRKSELLIRQQKIRASRGDPFGGFSTINFGKSMPNVYVSPGPIYEPEGANSDYARSARALFAAGFRSGDLIHNCFSYHFTPAGILTERGAHALGCTVFAGGTGQTELQVQTIAELRATGYAGTPSFLRIIIEKTMDMNIELPSLKKASLGAEAFPASLCEWLTARGVNAYQSYGTADVGLIAYETSAREGLVVDEGVIVEIVRPGTGDPVPDGEVGELVVTNFNKNYPLVRFGTGDLSAILPGTCPTGRTNNRIKGWMGRADQTTKVRGMFVHPGQISRVLKQFPEVMRARLVVSGEMANDHMTLRIEGKNADGLKVAIANAMREITKLRCEVEVVSIGVLPNDGKVIEDARTYQ